MKSDTLFDTGIVPTTEEEPNNASRIKLGQYFMPRWASYALVTRFFPDLRPGKDVVVEPGCGSGSFLQAIPDDVEVIGVEIDERLALEAERRSGRRVICGDFRTVILPTPISAVIGNPPFATAIIHEFLARAYGLLPNNGRCGFVLPAFAIQSHRRVMGLHEKWSLRQEALPRRLFPRLREPLVFILFTKERNRSLVGFALYPEMVQLENLSKQTRRILKEGRPRQSVWRAVVEDVLERLGGQATLDQIYSAIEPRRPTPNAFWREKVRQTLQFYFERISAGVWALPEELEEATA